MPRVLEGEHPLEPDVLTDKTWPRSVREGALAHALEQVGQRETAHNQGPIVKWSTEGLPVHVMHPQWCAYFVCQCYRRELMRRGDHALLNHWLTVVSGSCDRLWQRLEKEGWVWERIGGPPPVPGDLIFYGTKGDKNHVGIVKGYDPEARVIETVEGNSGRRADRVAQNTIALSAPSIYGFARYPL